MIKGHVVEVSSRVLTIIGRGLRSLQWSGKITFDELNFEEDSQQAVLVSRMKEKNIRSAVTMVQDSLDAAGYDYEFDVLKLDESPYFQIEYTVELRESDEDGSSSDDEMPELLPCHLRGKNEDNRQSFASKELYAELFDMSIADADIDDQSETGGELSGFDFD